MSPRLFIATIALAAACSGTPGTPHSPDPTSPDAEAPDAEAPDAAAADASSSDDGGPLDGDPIEAPADTWTWIDFPESRCGNGAATGIGVNLTDRSDDVFVFFNGGGACWDVNTCFVLKSAVNIESGYTAASFAADPVPQADAFDRDRTDNPLRDMSWVYIPYCTGDLHAGDKVTTYSALGQTRDVHHVGAANAQRFLARLGPTFAAAGRVFVSGASAGGYGAQLNFHRFATAFPDAQLHVLSDSGPLVQPYGGRLGEMNAAWDLQAPPDCADCATSFPRWFDHLVQTYPATRFGLLNYDADQVIHTYWAYPIGNSFFDALSVFVTDHYEPPANTAAFILAGTQHVLLGNLFTLTTPGGVRLQDWVAAWIDGGETWATVRP